MMFDKSPAKTYHAAIANLQKREAAYAAALADVDTAIERRRANDLPSLRRKADAAEVALKEALGTADEAWKNYWRGRLEEIKPQLKDLAKVIRQYDVITRIISSNFACVRPANAFIENAYIELGPMSPDEALDESGVPAQSPDSELLEWPMGS